MTLRSIITAALARLSSDRTTRLLTVLTHARGRRTSAVHATLRLRDPRFSDAAYQALVDHHMRKGWITRTAADDPIIDITPAGRQQRARILARRELCRTWSLGRPAGPTAP